MSSPYRFLWMRFSAWARRSFSVVWLMLLAGYLLVLAGQSVYKNYQVRQDTAALRAKLASSQHEEARLKALIVYYQTDSFKEKELRRALLLQEPGEKVYALPESGVARQPGDDIVNEAAHASAPETRPIWRQWVDYLLHRSA